MAAGARQSPEVQWRVSLDGSSAERGLDFGRRRKGVSGSEGGVRDLGGGRGVK